MRAKPSRSALELRLGYTFTRPELLESALTHASAAAGETALSNQRLEFLGDRVLGLAAADLLYRAVADATEGELSHRLSELVRRETCAAVAAEWDLAPHLILGSGQSRAGGRRNGAILADTTEAVLGAVYLDGGYEAARAVAERALAERIAAGRPRRDPKTALQEWAQADGRPVPRYAIVARSGPDHAPSFRVAVSVDGLAGAEAEGRSRRLAEQEAARSLLVREGVWTEAVPHVG